MPHVSFVLAPSFRFPSYLLALEILQKANAAAGCLLITSDTRTFTRGPVRSAKGDVIAPDAPVWAMPPLPDLVLIVASSSCHGQLPAGLQAFLARAARYGATIGGLDAGTLVLAKLDKPANAEMRPRTNGEANCRRTGKRDAVKANWGGEATKHTLGLDDGGGCGGGCQSLLGWMRTVLPLHVLRHIGHNMALDFALPAQDNRPQDPLIATMVTLISSNMHRGIAQIAQDLGLSQKRLRRRCIAVLGYTPRECHKRIGQQRAADLLTNSEASIAAIAWRCGFRSPAAFTRAFRGKFGLTPRGFRNQHYRAAPTVPSLLTTSSPPSLAVPAKARLDGSRHILEHPGHLH